MKEELTTKMHAEFSISEETDRKHGAFAALQMIGNGCTMAQVVSWGGTTEEAIRKYHKSYEELTGKKVSLE